jgi:hypothetical protein
VRIDQNHPLPPTPETIALATAFLLRKWQERWHEKYPRGPSYNAADGWNNPPEDLSSSCKFSSLFAQKIFGGEIRGNYDHQFVVLPDGSVLDLNIDAADVKSLKDPHRHDPRFFGSRDHRESSASCEARVSTWVEEFSRALSTQTRS